MSARIGSTVLIIYTRIVRTPIYQRVRAFRITWNQTRIARRSHVSTLYAETTIGTLITVIRSFTFQFTSDAFRRRTVVFPFRTVITVATRVQIRRTRKTHTHIQTADERILPQGTAYITDLGMVGPWNSVLGVEAERILYKFQTGMPVRFELAAGPNVFSAVLLTVSDETGNAEKIERIMIQERETL